MGLWIGLGVLVLVNIVGWTFTYFMRRRWMAKQRKLQLRRLTYELSNEVIKVPEIDD